MIARIRESGKTLTVHYPAVRPVATGTSPGTAPLSPLTGTAPTLKVIPTAAETPSQAPVTVDCLWLNATVQADGLRNYRIERAAGGWFAGAQACARVVLEDVLLDAADLYGDTVFKAASHIEYSGHRYQILAVQPFGSSFGDPATAYVWCSGATGQ